MIPPFFERFPPLFLAQIAALLIGLIVRRFLGRRLFFARLVDDALLLVLLVVSFFLPDDRLHLALLATSIIFCLQAGLDYMLYAPRAFAFLRAFPLVHHGQLFPFVLASLLHMETFGYWNALMELGPLLYCTLSGNWPSLGHIDGVLFYLPYYLGRMARFEN